MSALLENDTREDITTQSAEPGDHDLFTHYAPKAQIEAYWFNGTPVTALCGKTWEPNRDFTKYPLCGTCKDEYEKLRDE